MFSECCFLPFEGDKRIATLITLLYLHLIIEADVQATFVGLIILNTHVDAKEYKLPRS